MGNTNGYNLGYDKGKTDGYNSGNKNGYNTGYTAGYNQGKTDTKLNGLKLVGSGDTNDTSTHTIALYDYLPQDGKSLYLFSSIEFHYGQFDQSFSGCTVNELFSSDYGGGIGMQTYSYQITNIAKNAQFSWVSSSDDFKKFVWKLYSN